MFENFELSKTELLAIATAACLMAVPAVSHAQTYADETNRLQAQIQLLQLYEQRDAALRRQVDPSLTSLPQVVAVMGMEGQLKARLLSSNGVTHTYTEGESINSYMKVVAITTREVVVAVTSSKKKSKPILAPLQFLAGAQAPSPGGMGMQPGVSVGMPAPLPAGLLPSPPSVNFGSAPQSVPPQPALSQRQPVAPAGAATQAVKQPPSASPAPGPAASPPPAGGRPDQDLIDASAGQPR